MELSIDDQYLQKQATFLKSEISFATCCTEPIVELESKKLVECSSCKKTFHKHCVGIKSKKSFNCGICTMPTAGIEWGVGKLCTCPLDSTLQPILIRCQDDPKLITAITKTSYDNPMIGKTLGRMIKYAQNSDWEGLHKQWSLGTSKFSESLFGTTSEIFWSLVQNGGKFDWIITCSLCPNEEKEQTSQNIPMVNQRLSLSQNFENMFLSEVPTKRGGCLKCCNGDRLVSTYPPSTEETW
jgi:hypothetical protein